MTKEESSQIGDNWIRRGFAGGGVKMVRTPRTDYLSQQMVLYLIQ